MAIYITGDTHGELDRHKLTTKSFPEQKELTKDDYMIILGDAGILWNSYTKYCPNKLSSRDKNMIKWYEDKQFTTLWLDGNHENFNALNTFPVEIWNGGKIHRLSKSVIHLMRGQVYNINNITFFVMGGADSIDKMYREENVSWWRDELPSRKEYEEAIHNLEKVNFKVNYVLTHCCGTQLLPSIVTLHAFSDELTQFLWYLEKDFGLKYKHWYFGHHQCDRDIGNNYTCMYNNIIKLT